MPTPSGRGMMRLAAILFAGLILAQAPGALAQAPDWLWAQRAGGSGFGDQGRAIAVDESGQALVTGAFQGTAEFGDVTLNSAASVDVFVAKLDSDSGSGEAASRADRRGPPFRDDGYLGDPGNGVASDPPMPEANAGKPTGDGAAGVVAATPGLMLGEWWDGRPRSIVTLWGNHRASR